MSLKRSNQLFRCFTLIGTVQLYIEKIIVKYFNNLHIEYANAKGFGIVNFIIFLLLAGHNKICTTELREHRANLGCKSTNERCPNCTVLLSVIEISITCL